MSIKKNSLRESARNELTDHMAERFGELTGAGTEPEEAARQTVERMGDPALLGKRITAANRSNYSLITLYIGALLFVLVLFYTVLTVGDASMFIDMPGIISVAGLSAAYGLLSCKGKPTLIMFIRGIKNGALYIGGLCFITGLISMLYTMNEDPAGLGAKVAFSLLSLFYGIIISIIFRAVETRLSAPSIIREILE